MRSWVSLLVQGASSDSGSAFSGFGGHALIAIYHHAGKNKNRYEVFHLVGARHSSSGGSGHTIYNANASVERYRCDETGKAFSCGGRSGKDLNSGLSFNECNSSFGEYGFRSWYKTTLNKKLNIKETKRFEISDIKADQLIQYCMELCDEEDVGAFSLIGGQFKMGTNCISWAYQALRTIGITFDWTLYAMSFVSPRKAIESGGGLQRAV